MIKRIYIPHDVMIGQCVVCASMSVVVIYRVQVSSVQHLRDLSEATPTRGILECQARSLATPRSHETGTYREKW